MAYDSRTYRILIASPSDVGEEREIAVSVIQAWNDLHSHARQVVLLPLRWETHAAPDYGSRPQEVINRAIVDNCDLLLGVFWTRIGTATGTSESGTLEEIDRVAKLGKAIMLYFSRVGADPGQLDLPQLERLRIFKEKTYPNALTESYKSHIEFRDKFAKQLEMKVRDLQLADKAGAPPALSLEFALDGQKGLSGASLDRIATRLVVPDLQASLSQENERIRAAISVEVRRRLRRAAAVPVLLALRNVGSSGIRNLYIEVAIAASNSDTEILDSMPNDEHRGMLSMMWLAFNDGRDRTPDEVAPRQDPWDNSLRKDEQGWRFMVEWDALQPHRTRFIQPRIFVVVEADDKVEFMARVFADSLPEPVLLKAVLHAKVEEKSVAFSDLLSDSERLRERLSKSAAEWEEYRRSY